jgi:hypothetical protein
MANVQMVLAVLALICFLLGIVGAQPPATRPINWVSAGLSLLTIIYLIRS